MPVAPIGKKPGVSPVVKYGTGKPGAQPTKSPGGKITATVNPTKIQTKPSVPMPSKVSTGIPSTSSKPSASYSYTAPKSSKTTFGIIWLPSRKQNKKKEIAYNSHRYDRHKEYKDRGPSMYNFMSGDSHNTNKKEEDNEKDLLVPNRVPVAIAGASAAAVMEPSVITAQPEEKQEFINPDKDKEESNEASVLHKNEKEGSDYLEHNDSTDKSLDSKWDQDRGDKGDKVDSVYLGPPPPHKARSNTSTPATEEEDCGIKCLYYTLQCCDCVLM